MDEGGVANTTIAPPNVAAIALTVVRMIARIGCLYSSAILKKSVTNSFVLTFRKKLFPLSCDYDHDGDGHAYDCARDDVDDYDHVDDVDDYVHHVDDYDYVHYDRHDRYNSLYPSDYDQNDFLYNYQELIHIDPLH